MSGSPPEPPIAFKPAWGEYGGVAACEWCWRPTQPTGLLGFFKSDLTIATPLADLHFCDKECLGYWHHFDQTPRREITGTQLEGPVVECEWCLRLDVNTRKNREGSVVRYEYATLIFCDQLCQSLWRESGGAKSWG